MVMLCLRVLLVNSVLLLPGASPNSEFPWVWNGAYNNQGWGRYCYDVTEHKPLCGWKVVLKSSLPLLHVDVWDSTYNTSDNYIFTLTNDNGSADFNKRDLCSNINYQGTFGNVVPDMAITWFCVCDQTTGGKCKNVNSPTLASSLTDPTGHPLLGTYSPMIKSVRATSGPCYNGKHSILLAGSTHIVDCGTSCGSLSTCTGFNYREGARECALVYEHVGSNSLLMTQEEGCRFWTVYRK